MKDEPHANHADDVDSPEYWRDARLAQALRHMPDAKAQPAARTRHAVLQHAREALAGTPKKRGAADALHRWLRGWWGSTASGARWSLALASLAVFGFMALLWQAQMVEMGERGERGGVEDVGHTREKAAETAVVADGTPVPTPAPAPESTRAPAAPAAASVLAQSKTARARVVVPVTPPAPAMPPVQQTSPTTVAKLEEMVSADTKASANAVAPPPPALAAPVPSVAAALPAAPAMAEAKLQQRSRVAERATPLVVHILVGKRQGRIDLEQAGELLGQLRALRYGTASGELAAGVAGAVAQEVELVVVEMEGQERWVIAPDYVEHHPRVAKDTDAGMDRSVITPAQYAQFQRLVRALLSSR